MDLPFREGVGGSYMGLGLGRVAPRIITPFIVAITIGAVLGACDEAPPKQDKADISRPAKILVVKAEVSRKVWTYPGKVQASQEAVLAFEVAGRLIELPVLEGQTIKKDDLIARLDPKDFQLAINEQDAKLKEIKAELDRTATLLKQGHVSRARYDKVKRSYDVQVATVELANRNLQYATVKAPFTGFIAKKHIDNFQSVTRGQQIVTLQDLSNIDITTNVPEALIANIRNLQVVSVTAELEAIAGRTFKIKYKEHSTVADPQTQTYEVTLTMKAPADVTIRPGMTATVRAVTVDKKANATPVMVVPSSAVGSDESGKFYVWIVDPKSSRVAKRFVSVGNLDGGRIQVKGGLKDNERIVVAGINFLRDGMKVRPFN